MARARLQEVYVDELLLEAMSGRPDEHLTKGYASEILKAADRGASLESHVGRLSRLLVARPYKKLSCASSVDHSVVHGLLHYALHHDKPLVVTQLRTTCAAAKLTIEIYKIDHRKRISDRCMVALLDGIERESLAIRDQAMRLVHQDARRVAPVMSTVLGELFAGEAGRGRYQVKSPGLWALRSLIEHACSARSITEVVSALEPRTVNAKTSTAARGALAAVLTVHGRFAELEPLATTAAARTAVLEGAYLAVCTHKSRLGAAKRVPAHRAFHRSAIAAMSTLAKTKPQREIVADADGNVSRRTFGMFR
ncbi:MAG: hypothetical protein ABI867_42205 [Kofleriaceae bacterium]